MTCPKTTKQFEAKEAQLRSCGVLPLWYQAETAADHETAVEGLLERVIERISARPIATSIDKPRRRHTPARSVPALAPPPAKLQSHFGRVTRLVQDGRLVFVLGSAIYLPTRLMAAEFYKELSRVFECEALKDDQFAVAQYIADRHGRETLNREIRKLFDRTPLVPRETHELFAAWPTFRTSAGSPVPFPTIVTTNYDDVLERRLADAGLPYHLLSYQADGPHRGLFYHRDADDTIRLIERPENIQRFSPAFVLVKLNGGFDRQRRIPESYATARLDFWDLAVRLGDVLPAAVRRTLLDSPLLFLGHGLASPDIEALVRFAHQRHPGPRSWAVKLKRPGTQYWRQCGVEILDRSIELYVNELRAALTRSTPASP
jgi:hypothetical protein